MSELVKVLPSDTNYITISGTTNRITVRKACLEKIGNPEYVVFMMQDDGKAAALRPAKQNEDEAVHVTPSCYTKYGMFQFGGKLLVGSIITAMNWEKNMAYRVAPDEMEDNTLIFEFKNAVKSSLSAIMSGDLGVADSEEEETTYYWKDTHKPIMVSEDGQPAGLVARAEEDDQPQKLTTPEVIEDIPIEERQVMAVDLSTEESVDKIEETSEKPYTFINDEVGEWAKFQLSEWHWDENRIEYWQEEMEASTNVAMKRFLEWRTGRMTQDDFLVHHKDIEQMDAAFEFGRRVSIIRRIRANIKAFNPTMMAIIYDEKADTCEEILSLLKRYPHMNDYEIAMQVSWD